MPSIVTLIALLAIPDSVFDNKTKWDPEETDGALTLEGRPVKDSNWLEYRVLTTTDVPVEHLCGSVFEQATKGKGGANVKTRKLVKDGETERVLYDQVEAPMVSMRDYAMTVTRLPGEGACRIRFKITNDKAPALPDGVVRMENMWGGWDFEPKNGKTQVTHFLYADPGGAVPAWIARPSQKKALKEAITRMIAKAKETAPK